MKVTKNQTPSLVNLVLTAVLLSSILFVGVTSSAVYDPWVDYDDDGDIDVDDLFMLASVYGTSGTPVNKTALLLELQEKVDSLNASLTELQSRVEALEDIVLGVGEDYTTFTEVDPNSHVTIASSHHIDARCYGNEDAYVYKDMDAGHFTDFEHLVNARFTANSGSAMGTCWAVSNTLDDTADWSNYYRQAIGIHFRKLADGTTQIRLWESEDHAVDIWSDGPIQNIWYYLTITKNGTSVSCKIYGDSARTSLLTTLSVTLLVDRSYQYIFAENSHNRGYSEWIQMEIENLDLQET